MIETTIKPDIYGNPILHCELIIHESAKLSEPLNDKQIEELKKRLIKVINERIIGYVNRIHTQ